MNEFVREYLAAKGFNETLKQCCCPGDDDGNLKQFKKFKKRTMKSKKSRKKPQLSLAVS